MEGQHVSDECKQGYVLTSQAFTDEHLKPPPPTHGSVNVILTDTFCALVNGIDAVTEAVGETVSAYIMLQLNKIREDKSIILHIQAIQGLITGSDTRNCVLCNKEKLNKSNNSDQRGVRRVSLPTVQL